MTPTLEIDVLVSMPFMENTLIVRRTGERACAIVDPGFQPSQIVRFIEQHRLEPTIILLTHGHADHIAGNQTLKQRWPALPIVIGARDAVMLSDPEANLSSLGGVSVTSPPADRLLHEGDTVEAAGLEWRVLDIPGHSPGHVVYVSQEISPPIVLGGDVLFQGSIGRCDFPGGDQNLLLRGIRTKLFTLPPETIVYPGHGPTTTTGIEQQSNPYCGERAGLFEIS